MWNSRRSAAKLPLLLGLGCWLTAPASLAAPQGQTQIDRSQTQESDLTKGMTSFRRLVVREESEGRTFERWMIEAPSVNGGEDLLYQVEQETVQTGPRTSRSVRKVFGTDADGSLTLVRQVVEERRTDADGSQHVVRDFTQPDTNGRSKPIRREVEETAAEGQGRFLTQVQVMLPDINQSDFSPTERIVTRERRQGEKILEADQTQYRRSGRDQWRPFERRITTNQHLEAEVRSKEQVYRPGGGSRELSLDEEIVSRQWTDQLGQQQSTEETYSRDIPGKARSKDLHLLRRVTEVRSKPSEDGVFRTVQETEERRLDRMRVVERVVETSRPNGQGGLTTERQVFKLDVNGRLAPFSRRFINQFPCR